jgi:hypothetical protein
MANWIIQHIKKNYLYLALWKLPTNMFAEHFCLTFQVPNLLFWSDLIHMKSQAHSQGLMRLSISPSSSQQTARPLVVKAWIWRTSEGAFFHIGGHNHNTLLSMTALKNLRTWFMMFAGLNNASSTIFSRPISFSSWTKILGRRKTWRSSRNQLRHLNSK